MIILVMMIMRMMMIIHMVMVMLMMVSFWHIYGLLPSWGVGGVSADEQNRIGKKGKTNS